MPTTARGHQRRGSGAHGYRRYRLPFRRKAAHVTQHVFAGWAPGLTFEMVSTQTSDALFAYTWSRGDTTFIHQHAVDAFAAQNADDETPPIKLAFALIGLYLLIERRRTGREIQRVHGQLAQRKDSWPRFAIPTDRGGFTVADVMMADEGPERDKAIHAWCQSVWAAFIGSRRAIEELLQRHGV